LQGSITIYTDGAARGNPGPSASGYVVYRGGEVIRKQFVCNGEATNNYAEYRAILLALEWCRDNLKADQEGITLYSDSELVVRQINGHYKVKSKTLMELNREVMALAPKFKGLEFRNVGREEIGIRMVDKQLNILLDRKEAQKSGKGINI
jgi:ribonuclease HI